MKLLFITMSVRAYKGSNGELYINTHMNRNTISRYSDLCDELTMVIRDGHRILTDEEVNSGKYNTFPKDLAKSVVEYDPYESVSSIIGKDKKQQYLNDVENLIKNCDKVIFSAGTGTYTNLAINFCKKYHKKYLILVGGFAFETWWNHSLSGKIFAPAYEYTCKKNLAEAPYALYVTEKVLQRRYPCAGMAVGCSDVEIPSVAQEVEDRRINRIHQIDNLHIFTLATAASVSIRNKGQETVIRALYKLKKEGISNIKYFLIGDGERTHLTNIIHKYGMEEQVEFMGVLNHYDLLAFYDKVDIYIQPSYSEGLSRAIVEAMSMGCPVLCSRVGGNIELCNSESMFRAGDINQIASKIRSLMNKEKLVQESRRNFEFSKEFREDKLNNIRNKFLNTFIQG